MKKIAFWLLLLSVFSLKAQDTISFPHDFKLPSNLLDGMSIASISDDFHSEGIFENPAVLEDKDIIRMASHLDSEDISLAYLEVYLDEGGKGGDAGVVISQFVSEQALQNALDSLRFQDNLGYLTKENYLILVWSDVSNKRAKHIRKMADHYLIKIGAKIYQIGEAAVESNSDIIEKDV